MKKFYSEPEAEIRKYVISQDVCTTPSNPGNEDDLNKDDSYDYFPGGN